MSLYSIQLARERSLLLGWSLGFLVYFLIIGAYFSAVRDLQGYEDIWNNLPESLREAFGGAADIRSPGGYLRTEGASLLPLLLGGALLAQATRRLSGAEQGGELDLLLSLPVRRSSYLWSTWAVGATLAGVWTAAAALGAVLGMAIAGVDGLDLARVAYIIVEVLPFGLAVQAGALLAGAGLHRRGPGLAIVAAALAASFLVQILASLGSGTSWMRWLSPYALWLEGDPAQFRTSGWYLLSCVLVVAICLPLASWVWQRKDFKG